MGRFAGPLPLCVSICVLSLSAQDLQAQAVAATATIHRSVLTLDTHVDIPDDFATAEQDPGADAKLQIDLPKMRRGELDAAVFTVFAWQQARTPVEVGKAVELGKRKLSAIQRMAGWYPNDIAIATSPEQLEQLHTAGKRAAVIGVLNATVLGANSEWLQFYFDHGMRQLGLVHAGHNDYADSSRPLARLGDAAELWGGLSPRGRTLLRRLNDLGVIVDVSQLSAAALRETLQRSRAPVIASHSAVRARVDTARNLSDAEITAIAAGGGVVSVVAFSAYLRNPPPEFAAQLTALRAKYNAPDDVAVEKLPEAERAAFQRENFAILRAQPRATVRDWMDAVDYVVKLAGIKHVALSTDFHHAGGIDGYSSADQAPNITAELVARGYSQSDIAKIWGGNYLRLWRQVLASARTRR
jgi:membrane dipeptidase